MDSLDNIVKPMIDENIRQFNIEANKLKSSFVIPGRLKSGLYIISITDTVQGFMAKCREDIEEICIKFNFSEKDLNKYIHGNFTALVFQLFEQHVKCCQPSENAMKQQKEVLSDYLKNMSKATEQKIKLSKPKWYASIRVILSAVVGGVIILKALIEIFAYFGVTKENLLTFFQRIF